MAVGSDGVDTATFWKCHIVDYVEFSRVRSRVLAKNIKKTSAIINVQPFQLPIHSDFTHLQLNTWKQGPHSDPKSQGHWFSGVFLIAPLPNPTEPTIGQQCAYQPLLRRVLRSVKDCVCVCSDFGDPLFGHGDCWDAFWQHDDQLGDCLYFPDELLFNPDCRATESDVLRTLRIEVLHRVQRATLSWQPLTWVKFLEKHRRNRDVLLNRQQC